MSVFRVVGLGRSGDEREDHLGTSSPMRPYVADRVSRSKFCAVSGGVGGELILLPNLSKERAECDVFYSLCVVLVAGRVLMGPQHNYEAGSRCVALRLLTVSVVCVLYKRGGSVVCAI